MLDRWWILLVVVAAGCERPSAGVDGRDLRGVFDGGSASASASAAPAASTAAAPASATGSARAAPPPPRAPEAHSCVEVRGEARRQVIRTVGRPACRGAEVIEWRDPAGAPRYACFYGAPGGPRGALPLVVFLHGDGPGLDTAAAVQKQTGLRALQRGTALGDEPGFHVLSVQGRALAGEPTVTFDAAATGPDNLDLATIDHFVGEIEGRGIVDRRRIYAVGLGPGGRMAATWAMIRADRVAAFASFGAPPPTARWTCPGPPPPGVVVYRACDAVVPCDEVEGWLRSREAARAETHASRIGDDDRQALHCEVRNSCGTKRGTAAHARWPKRLEKRILESLGAHALAVGRRP